MDKDVLITDTNGFIDKTVEWRMDYYHKNLVNTVSDIESYVTEVQKRGIV